MNEFDPRVVTLVIEINGMSKTYSSNGFQNSFSITAKGMKYANPLQNEAEITITNLNQQDSDTILTETSPFNLNTGQKIVYLYAGRESYGTSLIYKGNIVSSRVSQPPDITITLRCLTGDYEKSRVISRTKTATAKLSDIAKSIADDLNMQLDFTATDKDISNYNFTGSVLREVNLLSQLSNIDAFIDDDSLVVKQSSIPIPSVTKIVNVNTGMIGIVDITERGMRVIFLLDNFSRVGGLLRLSSVINPTVDGDYIIYKLGFDIATRDTPFYYIAEAKRLV